MKARNNIEPKRTERGITPSGFLFDFQKLQSMEFLRGLLDTLPYIVTIINKNRQIIYTNDHTIMSLGFNSIVEVIGKLPGDILHCENAGEYPKLCGTSQKCQVCSILSTVLDSQVKNKKITREARLVSKLDGKTISFNLLVSASPFNVNGKSYQVLIINDISQEKRRRILERIFFHDVINKSGSLMGLIKLLSVSTSPVQQNELLDDLNNLATDLTEEILAQRDLVAAENGELKVNYSKINTLQLLDSIIDQVKYHEVANKRNAILDHNAVKCDFTSDRKLINRVITNMVKNAFEAIHDEEVVTLSCVREDHSILFSVHNPGFIQKDVQLQIFMRSFSTKSTTRGLGTYSMRLLAEQYLDGEVYFTSDNKNGTTFYISLPLSPKKRSDK